jgi:hypothetical protein
MLKTAFPLFKSHYLAPAHTLVKVTYENKEGGKQTGYKGTIFF